MRASGNVYNSARLVEGYATSRPALHPLILNRVAARLGTGSRRKRALDLGSGVGLSTAPLGRLANTVVGIEPSFRMLGPSGAVAPGAIFLSARSEAVPFRDRTFDLITAAGSLNYTDLDLALPEASRLLAPSGALVIYDFGSGRRFPNDSRLDAWFAEFEERHPFPPGYAMDVPTLPYGRFGLRLEAFDEFDLTLPMSLDSYLRYLMTETSVEQAISRGESQEGIRAWCTATLRHLFPGKERDVLFHAYIAYVAKEA